MSAYTKLKTDFDHLQKRMLQLFDYGRKREGILETAVVQAWKYFGEIAEVDNVSDMKRRASAMKGVMESALSENARVQVEEEALDGI